MDAIPVTAFTKLQTADYMSLGALEFKFWKNFCVAVGREDLIGTQFGESEVMAQLDVLFASKTQEQWTEIYGRCRCVLRTGIESKRGC